MRALVLAALTCATARDAKAGTEVAMTIWGVLSGTAQQIAALALLCELGVGLLRKPLGGVECRH